MKNRTAYFILFLLISAILLGIFQNFFITGVAWNLLFYPIQCFAAITAWKNKHSKSVSRLSLILLLFCLGQLTWNAISNERTTPSDNPTQIKVMTYNLYFKNRNSESSIKVIRNANPDILFVQELTSAWKAILEKSLGKQYPYHKTKPQEGTHGIGIYSKYPLKGSTLLVNRNKLPYAQLSEIKIKGKRIQLVNVHLASPAVAVENRDRFASLYWQNYKQRAKELNKISAIIHRDKGQFESQLLVGDLNTLFVEPIFQSLKKDWVNTYQKCGGGLGLNFPNSSRSKPIMTLDYIMARGKVNCIEASVLKGGNSDHLPILAELEL